MSDENAAQKTIFRTRRTRDFTTVPNALARDKSLSFKARGLMLMVLSNVDEWEVHQSWLSEQATEGREAIRSAMQELEAAGYVAHEEARVSGRIVGSRWTFHDEPLSMDQRTNRTHWRNGGEPQDGKPSHGEPQDGKPCDGKPSPKKEHRKEKHGKENAARGYSIPLELNSLPDFEKEWQGFIQARKVKRKPLTDRAAELILGKLVERPGEAITALQTVIVRGWTSFEWSWLDRDNGAGAHGNGGGTPPPRKPQDAREVARRMGIGGN